MDLQTQTDKRTDGQTDIMSRHVTSHHVVSRHVKIFSSCASLHITSTHTCPAISFLLPSDSAAVEVSSPLQVPWKKFSLYAADVLSTFQVHTAHCKCTLHTEYSTLHTAHCRASSWTRPAGRAVCPGARRPSTTSPSISQT